MFDIDSTLAPPNEPIENSVIQRLKQFEKQGIFIGLISGKPISYISGLARQSGLERPILVGENGGVIHYSAKFPPERSFITFTINKKAFEELKKIQDQINAKFTGYIWVQPNLINYTIFPLDGRVKSDLFEYVEKIYSQHNTIVKYFTIYTHIDAIEIVPRSVNKGLALKYIKKSEKIKKNEIITVGDGENDLPMMKESGYSIGINMPLAKINVRNINEALKSIAKIGEGLGHEWNHVIK